MDTSTETFNILSLCSGGGGLDLGLHLAIRNARVVCYVEREVFACSVLAKRMQEKNIDEAPIWTDVTTFDGKPWNSIVDCIIGGIPCQPFSVMGKQKGDKDSRYLWDDVCKIIIETNPSVVFFENVGNILKSGFERIASTLSEMGFDVEADVFPAAEMGAPHLRERLFFLGHSTSNNAYWESIEGLQGKDRGRNSKMGIFPPEPSQAKTWEKLLEGANHLKPGIRNLDDELASGLDPNKRKFAPEQLRLLGNGVVPTAAGYAFCILFSRLQSRKQHRS